MPVTFEILGGPGADNAMLVRIDSGQALDRLLFDCGEGCVNSLSFSEIQELDHLFLSHLHMDHIGGFDHYFRGLFNRVSKPNHIWGPPQTSQILQHRFQGFLWNLHSEMQGTWKVTDIDAASLSTTRFELAEAFACAHPDSHSFRTRTVVLATPRYKIEAHTMDHRTPTLAYVVRESSRLNIDMPRVTDLGLKTGAWMKQLKDPTSHEENISIQGKTYSLPELRQTLLVEQPGDSLAYLTDFILDEAATTNLAAALQGCDTIVCEAQYRHADLSLARKNFHMTTVLSARLAQAAGVKKLVLFHLSDRYHQAEWLEMLAEARAIFPATFFPAEWNLECDS